MPFHDCACVRFGFDEALKIWCSAVYRDAEADFPGLACLNRADEFRALTHDIGHALFVFQPPLGSQAQVAVGFRLLFCQPFLLAQLIGARLLRLAQVKRDSQALQFSVVDILVGLAVRRAVLQRLFCGLGAQFDQLAFLFAFRVDGA